MIFHMIMCSLSLSRLHEEAVLFDFILGPFPALNDSFIPSVGSFMPMFKTLSNFLVIILCSLKLEHIKNVSFFP